jgi:hypothetical protein
MSVSISMSVPVSVSIKYGAMNIYVQNGNHSINLQGLYKVARKLKGPVHKRDDG